MAEGKTKEPQEQTETERDTGQCETDMADTNQELVRQRGWNGRGEDERATGRKTEGGGGREMRHTDRQRQTGETQDSVRQTCLTRTEN